MLKYLKYEMKNSMKFVLMLLAAVLVSTLLLQNFAMRNNNGSFVEFFAVIPVLIIMGSVLVYFVFTVNLMKKDLYEDKGYLTFSLPINGFQIVMAKVLCAFIYLLITTIIILFLNFFVARYITFPFESKMFITNVLEAINNLKVEGRLFLYVREIAKWMMFSITFTFANLSILYFSLVLGKVIIPKKKLSSLWFLIYIINNYFVAKLYELVLDTGIIHVDEYMSSLNTLSIILPIIVSVLLIFVSSFLLDKKVEI